MFKKLSKKKEEVWILKLENGMSFNTAREFAEKLQKDLGVKVVLIPYGLSLTFKD